MSRILFTYEHTKLHTHAIHINFSTYACLEERSLFEYIESVTEMISIKVEWMKGALYRHRRLGGYKEAPTWRFS